MFPLETIVAWAKRRGFVYPGSDIYGGLANAWDYGPYGSQLKKNIQDIWWKTFVESRADMIGLDSQILMHPKVRVASGHVAGFNDPLIDDKKTGERFRADKLIEERIEEVRKDVGGNVEYKHMRDDWVNLYSKLLEEKQKAGDMKKATRELILNSKFVTETYEMIEFVEDRIDTLNFELKDTQKIINSLLDGFTKARLEDNVGFDLINLVPESRTFEQMKAFIVKEIPHNPNTKKPADWTDVRKFELMFYTYQGVIHDEDNKIRMRPETAQGIFVNFRNVLDTTRMRIPFGIGQVGKAFRNEITPGNFLYRTREFEQMEIEYFVENDKEKALQALEDRKQQSMNFRKEIMQFQEENVRFREHESDELSHYSDGTFDVEFHYPRGWGELQGIAYRTDFDLKQHQQHSGKDMQYTDPHTGKRYIPHVIEPSFGLSRTLLAVLFDCYDEEVYIDGSGKEQTRVVVRFPKHLAPVKFAILPLIKKDDKQIQFAEDLYRTLSKLYACEYDDGGNIGKRYRRQDEIGTPYCLTIDHETVDSDSENYGTVTIRDRDSMQQTRISVDKITL